MSGIRVASIALLLAVATPAWSQGPSDVEVRVNARAFATHLGDSITLEVTLTNGSPSVAGPMTAHLMIVDPIEGTPLDPEDWTTAIAKRAGPIAAGGSQTLRWVIEPVAEGRFAMFVAVVAASPPLQGRPQTSPVVSLTVGKSRAGSTAAVPVSIGVPLALVALQLARTRSRRRTAGARRRESKSRPIS